MSVKKTNNYQRSFLSLLVVVIALLSAQGTLFAVNSGSTINAEICDNSPPVVTITSPVSDSIVNQPSVTLAGSTLKTSQIDIFVNNQYSSSIAIDSSQSFSRVLSLHVGTNTIRLRAIYSCNNTTTDKTVVISYVPTSTPGAGSETSTVTITPSDPGPGIISNPQYSNKFDSGIGISRSQKDGAEKKTITERLSNNFGFSRPNGLEWEYDFTWLAVVKASWLLFAIALLIIFFLSTAQLSWLFAYFGFGKDTTLLWRRLFRFLALLLSFLFVILVLA